MPVPFPLPTLHLVNIGTRALSLCGAIPKSSQLCTGSVPPTLKLLSRHEEIKHRQAHGHRRGSHERRGTVGSRPARSLGSIRLQERDPRTHPEGDSRLRHASAPRRLPLAALVPREGRPRLQTPSLCPGNSPRTVLLRSVPVTWSPTGTVSALRSVRVKTSPSQVFHPASRASSCWQQASEAPGVSDGVSACVEAGLPREKSCIARAGARAMHALPGSGPLSPDPAATSAT